MCVADDVEMKIPRATASAGCAERFLVPKTQAAGAALPVVATTDKRTAPARHARPEERARAGALSESSPRRRSAGCS